MTPERWRQITAVFHDALARAPVSRSAFLDRACASDSALRAEVDRLIEGHHEAGRFGDGLVRGRTASGTIGIPAEPAPAAAALRSIRALLWVTAAGVLATFAYAAWLLAATDGSPSFGWNGEWRDGRFMVAEIDPGGPAAGQLQRGDTIFSMNGIPLGRQSDLTLQRCSVSTGDTYAMAVERGGIVQEHRLSVAATPPSAGTLTMYAVSLVWCVTGLLIGFARPEGTLARLACLASLATGLVFLQVGVIRSGPLWQPLHAVLGYHFCSRFPTGLPPSRMWRWALVWMYVVGTPSAAAGLFQHATLLAAGPANAMHILGPREGLIELAGSLRPFSYTPAIIGMVLVLVHNYRRLTDEDQRRRVRWVVCGTTMALVPQVWWALLYTFEELTGQALLSRYSLFVNTFTVAIPLTVAYAVVKHRVLDIKVVVRLGLQYVLARRVLQTAIALPLLALAYTLISQRHLTIAEFVGNTRAYVFLLGAAATALRFRRPVQGWIDRRFFREEFDREQLLLGLLDDVGRVDSVAQLSRLVSDRLATALHPTAAYVWYSDAVERAVAASSDPSITPPDVPSSGSWLAWLEARGAVTECPLPADAGLSRSEARWFADRGISLVVPITDTDDRLVGALLLGEKKSEEPYGVGDRQLLTAIAKQAAVVRDNLRLRARVSDDARVRRDVLARLDGRMPDLLKECPTCGACFDGAVEHCERDGAALTLSLPVSRTVEGRYRLERVIGKGGMGAVYEARDLRLGRTVAVKIMLGRAFGQQDALRRFRREAQAAAHVNHPNIVGVYDFGSLEGEGAYLVMEYVHGMTLRSAIDRDRSMPPRVAAEWFGQILDGIAAAHACGIVHRDLKPENVMGRRDESGALTVKILDLGLVKFQTEARVSGVLTAQGVVMGTLGYMSPEQLLGSAVDHRTDLFALAVMLVEALTGERPFRGETYGEFLREVRHATYRLPESPPLPPALGTLLQRCLAAGADDRFPSAAALRGELLPVLRTASSTPDRSCVALSSESQARANHDAAAGEAEPETRNGLGRFRQA